MDELAVGDPARLATDIGPVIDAEAQGELLGPHRAHASARRKMAPPGAAAPTVPPAPSSPPTMLEIGDLAELKREVFGPVLHVLRYRRSRPAAGDRRRSTPPATA